MSYMSTEVIQLSLNPVGSTEHCCPAPIMSIGSFLVMFSNLKIFFSITHSRLCILQIHNTTSFTEVQISQLKKDNEITSYISTQLWC